MMRSLPSSGGMVTPSMAAPAGRHNRRRRRERDKGQFEQVFHWFFLDDHQSCIAEPVFAAPPPPPPPLNVNH